MRSPYKAQLIRGNKANDALGISFMSMNDRKSLYRLTRILVYINYGFSIHRVDGDGLFQRVDGTNAGRGTCRLACLNRRWY
ncbi:hypothetical protein MKW98_007077 [Papaver atlanticum]|uniref:Uncharacterized protein n=1 Tax=Papaver atlanticum TaxID=357466 RepID=A0AAD4XKI8_9MAGN|nr:hypothetical protein MKW98_007077 [Papaver atlanticum]